SLQSTRYCSISFLHSRGQRVFARPQDWSRVLARMPRRALIIGGSLGGLFAAHLLRAAGWEVDVYERIGEDLAGRGAGLGTHDALRDMMARVGLDVVRRLASPPMPTCAATTPAAPCTRSSSSG